MCKSNKSLKLNIVLLFILITTLQVSAFSQERCLDLFEDQKKFSAVNTGKYLNKFDRSEFSDEFNDVVDSLEVSHRVVMFKMGNYGALSKLNIKPNNSFVAILMGDVLVLGKDFVNTYGGTSGTHLLLYQYKTKREGEKTDYKGFGGAIHIDENGTIFVSGFHNKEPSLMAAERIALFLKSIDPNFEVYYTEGKLSEFQIR